jgi:purine-nucleoside phosphorylase
MEMEQKYQDSLDFIKKEYPGEVKTAIILGTGLGKLVDEMKVEKLIPYEKIPYFPVSTVESHAGRLVFGELEGQKVMVMQGRFHYYEGYTLQQVTYPVRVMKLLGIERLLISNVSGSLNLSYKLGDLMVIDDHINLISGNPLIGKNDYSFGPRFPQMSRPYDPEMINAALLTGKIKGFGIHKGVYVAVNGPTLETRAEYRFFRIIGGDVVGMSTVPESIVANHMGMKVFGISLVTDIGDPDNLVPVSLEEILQVAKEGEPKLTAVIRGVLAQAHVPVKGLEPNGV